MSRDASLTVPFGDGDYAFALKWGELIQLQEACDAGPYVILQRMARGAWRMQDISSVIRLGLIGGGLDVPKALQLTKAYVEARPPLETLALAIEVLVTALGHEDEQPGESSAGQTASA